MKKIFLTLFILILLSISSSYASAQFIADLFFNDVRTGEPFRFPRFDSVLRPWAGFTIASHLWDFGDGSTSVDIQPNHTYTTADRYLATLTGFDSRGRLAAPTIFMLMTVNDPPALFYVSPSSLNFSAQAGGPNPAAQNITITNLATVGRFTWTASADVSWLSLSPSDGMATAAIPSTVVVTANISGLRAGTHSGAITVDAGGTLFLTGGPEQGAVIRSTVNSPWTVEVVLQLERALTAIAITPSRVIIRPGEVQLMRATGTYSDGTQEDVSSTAEWQSSAPAVVAVSPGGEVRAVGPGEATITAQIGANSASATVLVNSPPQITSVPITEASVGSEYVYDAGATDANGDALNYSLITNPAGMQINGATGLITWRPRENQAGSQSVTIQVADAQGASVRQEFVISVRANNPPVITSRAITEAAIGEEYAYDVNATDSDGDELSYLLITNPAGMTINEITGLITWRPAEGQAGSQSVVVQVADARGASVRQDFVISIRANNPPEITSTAITEARTGQLYIYNLEARDPDGDPLSYSLLERPAGMTIDSATGDISWTPAENQVGNHAVNVSVSDGRGGTNAQEFNIAVSASMVTITGIKRSRPQVIAAGFDPILVDLTDDNFDIIAIVRPGAQPIRSVTLTQNQSQFQFGMNYSFTLPDGDQLWRAIFNFPRGSFGTRTLRAVWGDRPGEFNVTVIDEAQSRHSFPDIEFGNAPAITATIQSPATFDSASGIKRVRPQVLVAGLNPTIIDLSDDSFEIMAIVRPGAMPIRTVTLSENTGAFSLSMDLITELPNGDQLWSTTFNFPRGSFGTMTLRAVWGDQPGEFNVTVIDQAQQRHSFPDLEFGNNPAIN